MAVVCDTGTVYALYDADDSYHAPVRRAIEAETGPLHLPIVLLAEIDYLLTSRLGQRAAIDFFQSVQSGAFQMQPLLPADFDRCLELVEQYADLPLGIADASVAATAERLGVPRLLTVDEKHFRAVRPKSFDHFILIPADESPDDNR